MDEPPGPPSDKDFADLHSVYCNEKRGRSGYLSKERRRFQEALTWLFPFHSAMVEDPPKGSKEIPIPPPQASHMWFSSVCKGHPSIGNLGAFKQKELPLPFINRAQLDLAEKVSCCERMHSLQAKGTRGDEVGSFLLTFVIFDCFYDFCSLFSGAST